MTEDNYRPRSPDLSLPPPQQHAIASPITSYPPFFNSYQPYQPYQLPHPSRVSQQYVPPYQPDSDMARRSSRLAQSDHAPIPEPMPEAIQPMPEIIQPIPEPIAMAPVPAAAPEMDEEMPPAPPSAGIEVKTKFPVARIKRIMQADEDVGKVAQVTPIAVCKYTLCAALCAALRAYSLCFAADTDQTLPYSQGSRTLHDLSRHQGGTRSQGS